MLGTLTRNLETILVVDDNATILALVVAILEYSKFRVLSACSGAKAIELAKETEGWIDLLLSDVDMPQMSGPNLGETLKKTRPDMHVMLMAGGENGSLLVQNYGWTFIQKPFMPAKLIQMVTSALRSPVQSQPGGPQFDRRKRPADATSLWSRAASR